MAKRRSKSAATEPVAQGKIIDFAEDLGRILGTAQAKAEGWLGQRKAIAEQLAQIRDTASKYLQELTSGGAALAGAVKRGRKRGRPPGSKNRRGPGRPPGTGKKRSLSAAARKAISEAQKKRWAQKKTAE